jgi:hypothetical protein
MHSRKSFFLFPLCLLHLFLGLNGIAGGTLLVIKSDGSLLGMQPDWLDHSPFNNYLIPGILLSFFLGIIPLITLTGLIKRFNWPWTRMFNIYRNRYWAWSFSLYTGIIAIFWITIQLLLTRYFWIQPVIILTGLFIIILTMVPGVMRHFEIAEVK